MSAKSPTTAAAAAPAPPPADWLTRIRHVQRDLVQQRPDLLRELRARAAQSQQRNKAKKRAFSLRSAHAHHQCNTRKALSRFSEASSAAAFSRASTMATAALGAPTAPPRNFYRGLKQRVKSRRKKKEPEPKEATTTAHRRAFDAAAEATTTAHRRAFDAAADGAAEMPTERLPAALRSLGRSPPAAEVEGLQVLHGSTGAVSFAAFESILEGIAEDAACEAEALEAFRVLDRAGTGKVPAADLRQVMCGLGEKVEEDELDEMLRTADVDGNVDYVALVRSELGAARAETAGGFGLDDAEDEAAAVAAEEAGGADELAALLEQLRAEPPEGPELVAKFALFEAFLGTVERSRGEVEEFWRGAEAQFPEGSVRAALRRQIEGIDSAECMGVVFVEGRWFVYDMCKRVARNVEHVGGVLRSIEAKLALLDAQDAGDCPFCLEPLSAAEDGRTKLLGCCHKTCAACWAEWTKFQRRPFCPLCRNVEFVEALGVSV